MKVIVTGATGFLGNKVAYKIKELGYNPVAIGRNSTAGDALAADGIAFCRADLSQREAAIEALRGADYVVHCAGLSSVWGAVQEFERANVLAVRNIVEGCREHGVKRLVHISTPSLYFDYRDKHGITEADPLPSSFVNAYASSKWRGEELVLEASRRGLEAVILRPRGIFGPGDTTLFPRILAALRRHCLPLVDGGAALTDITYVDNVVDAIVAALHRPQAAGQAYNISNDEPMAFIELLRLLSDKLALPLRTRNVSFRQAYYSAKAVEAIYRLLRLSGEPPITCYGVGLVATTMTFDITKAKEELGYAPRVAIRDGMDAFADWWRTKCSQR